VLKIGKKSALFLQNDGLIIPTLKIQAGRFYLCSERGCGRFSAKTKKQGMFLHGRKFETQARVLCCL
jgi:hypothetical protein